MLLKSIPKVDKFITNKAFEGLAKSLISKISKEQIAKLRTDILENKIKKIDENLLINSVLKEYENISSSSLKTLINATGVIVHTNLGRSLLDKSSLEKAINIASSYNNLEYNLEKGQRGERYEHITKSLKELLGCEDALVVNNNASAVFLILNTFCKNKEVIVSRGELVEIGGSFRVPEVMSQSGAILKEIGTTNKTHLKDYKNAINENSAMLLKVHKSNYEIVGFSSEVSFEDISSLAKDQNIIDYYDMGSGHINELPYNLSKDEPSIKELMKSNPSLLSFSGDKLLGSVQAGIIVGKKELISKLKQNQLLRMLRVDKITLSILEDTINLYIKNDLDKIPTLKILNTNLEVLKSRALNLQKSLEHSLETKVYESKTVVGGGTTPNKTIPTIVLSLNYKDFKANQIEELLRENLIICRIENDKAILDFRTIKEEDLEKLEKKLKEIFKNG
ncbi:L-seryl-tRNA(Sec) selenium transferase [Aliarcobacter thereius]|uniref:L-seryl-tRNA(Sec) selenium transferase n=2 Tax=Aliarcobacter thereius TaxID=544718 RepID=A0A1C0B7M3_9BACT|nr:L-seryl-tRNA(Sec) selenium transferase [Aliarcobacter thereius]OCL94134.1 L-seryl-tRNA(Sec) selenium transferase [Aliarcobacter thereius]OCL95527.1 L-seryl-tRNA(Sec) selenium transferase [Aliarcobacter thereius LMG 24486]OCL99561.1 L-seryl-tRNA(Sec) selenium transferase [Aliarcobacter thereius]QBF16486.1 selenocysteine synthase [Aliarcobacter thereius LMG 24486]TLS72952.1 L-seryl-tRNA(Sec) selenium transferase [Aliarcobacter thereius]